MQKCANEKNLPDRKYPRLKNFDYSKSGVYFITICVQDRKNILSDIATNDNDCVGWGLAPTVEILLTQYGKIVEEELMQIKNRYPCVDVDNYVIMPNHIHLILQINADAVGASPHPTVMDIICAFKSLATRKCRCSADNKGRGVCNRVRTNKNRNNRRRRCGDDGCYICCPKRC